MEQLQSFHLLSTQVRILYHQSTITLLFPLLAAPAVYLLLRDISDPARLGAWVTVVTGYTLVRYYMVWRYGKVAITLDNANSLLDIFIAGVFISGLLWGMGAVFLVPVIPDRIVEYTLYNSMIMLVVCGLTAGAVVAYSANIWVLFFFAFPTLVPAAISLIAMGDKYNSALGGFVLLYFLFITASSYRLHRQFMHFINMEYQMILLSRRIHRYRSDQNKARKDGH